MLEQFVLRITLIRETWSFHKHYCFYLLLQTNSNDNKECCQIESDLQEGVSMRLRFPSPYHIHVHVQSHIYM